jgi:hypothetical protein
MSHREAAFEAGGAGGQRLWPAHAERGAADRAEAVINRLLNTEAAACLTADLPKNVPSSGESNTSHLPFGTCHSVSEALSALCHPPLERACSGAETLVPQHL